MKKTKKITAAVMALTMVSALAPMTAFADTVVDNKNNPAPKNASFDVSYTYTLPAPTYTVTIPAGVTLSDSESVAKEITAESVTNMEANGKKIVVTLDAATNDNDTDTTFHAKNGDSDATYTITAGTNAVKVGDTVAEFTANGSSALTFSKITLPASPVAGDYTETLTFGIALADTGTSLTYIAVNKMHDDDLDDVKFYYVPGETYRQAIANHTENSNWDIYENNSIITTIHWDGDGDLWINGDNDFREGEGECELTLDSVVDPTQTYEHDIFGGF